MTRTWRDYNYFLLGCVLVLTGFSLAMVYSATLREVTEVEDAVTTLNQGCLP